MVGVREKGGKADDATACCSLSLSSLARHELFKDEMRLPSARHTFRIADFRG